LVQKECNHAKKRIFEDQNEKKPKILNSKSTTKYKRINSDVCIVFSIIKNPFYNNNNNNKRIFPPAFINFKLSKFPSQLYLKHAINLF
jgi:hypothetical protein